MRRAIITVAFVAMLLMPATTGSVPSTPEPTPENGCVFADAVLKEIADEETRLYIELERASMARKVVLTVQVKSGENLRKSTQSWKNEHCIKL